MIDTYTVSKDNQLFQDITFLLHFCDEVIDNISEMLEKSINCGEKLSHEIFLVIVHKIRNLL